MTRDARPSPTERLLALASLAATGALTVAVVVFLVRNGPYVVMGIAGLLVAFGGAWWAASKSGLGRIVGVAAALLGLAVLVVALFAAGGNVAHDAVRAAVCLGLLAIAVLTARAARFEEISRSQPAVTRKVAIPRHPVLLCNPWSGGGKVERFDLVALASSMGVETVVLGPGLDLEALARNAIARGADCLAMAGGDGSQALVASIAVEHDVPFVCVSAGTRNHFALDLDLDRDDPRRCLEAFQSGIERRVDYATVNGRCFLNNVSLGVYATIVQEEGYREAKAATSSRMLSELLGRTDAPFDLQFETPGGESVDDSFLVMVSNNPYVLGVSRDVAQRRRLDGGVLGVFAVSAKSGVQAAQTLALALAGKGGSSRTAYEFTVAGLDVRSHSKTAFAGVDGEALELETPMKFRIHPQGLRVLVPPGNAEAVRRRRAREVHVKDLVSIVRGRVRAPEERRR